MVTAAEIGWGSYGNYEGPYHRGSKTPFVMPSNPNEDEKVMAVITATEGGSYSAFNGYDSCGWTSGIIQWIEKGQYSVSDMLGAVAENDATSEDAFLKTVDDMAKSCGYSFKKRVGGRYRFSSSAGVIDTYDEQKKLFYVHGDGTKGTWDDGTKLYARQWAAAISTVWENSESQKVQLTFTAQRLGGFMQVYAKGIFESMPDTDLARGVRAAYLSFAANNPTWANKALKAGVNSTTATPWTMDWAIAVLKYLTFNPQVAIYPHRYDCIRPVLEQVYGLQLPDFAAELKVWSLKTGIPAGIATVDVQRALIKLGYDLGPAEDDGKYGDKTRAAVLALEQTSGMVPKEAQDGMVDVYTFPALCAALEAKGLPLMSTDG